MKPSKSFAVMFLLCAAAVPILAHAQDYPSRPIQFVVPARPGTQMDVLARLLGPRISQHWNVPVIVDNKTGAAGVIGIDAVAKANPNGYTFLFTGGAFTTLAATNSKLPYDPIKSFASVSLLGATVMALVVYNKFPANNVREFVEQVKKQPGVFNYASPGIGTIHHLAMELFKQETGINLLHIPYNGSSGVLNDIVAGNVQAGVTALPTATPSVQSGRMRMLAVMGPERAPQLPQVPTMAEAGFANMVVPVWFGVMAPAGTPPSVIEKVNAELNDLLALPDVKQAMGKLGVTPAGGKPDKLDVLVRSEIKLWAQVIKRGNIVVE